MGKNHNLLRVILQNTQFGEQGQCLRNAVVGRLARLPIGEYLWRNNRMLLCLRETFQVPLQFSHASNASNARIAGVNNRLLGALVYLKNSEKNDGNDSTSTSNGRVGIVIGVVCFVIVTGGLASLVVMRRRSRSRDQVLASMVELQHAIAA